MTKEENKKMDKGISLFFGYISPLKKRLQKIKNIGFTSIITCADKKFDFQNGPLKKQVKEIKKVGLKLSSLHATYNKTILPEFFKDSKVGDKIEKGLIKEVKLAKKYGFKSLVVHLEGYPSKLGLDRINRILKVCEKCKVPLAIENLCSDGNLKIVDYLFKNIDNEYLKFCFDSGHNNAYHKHINYLDKYKDKVVALHLHDNDGNTDQHTLNQFGTRDWDKTAKDLSKCDKITTLDYEVMMNVTNSNLSEDETLKLCYQNAKELENMIEKYKKINTN